MSQEHPEEFAKVGSPFHFFTPFAIRAIGTAAIAGVSMAVVFLFDLLRLLILVIAPVFGWRIFYASYQFTDPTTKRKGLVDSRVNHIILVAAILAGGILTGALYGTVCAKPHWIPAGWLTHLTSACTGTFSFRVFFDWTIVGSGFLMAVPGTLAYFIWGHVSRS